MRCWQKFPGSTLAAKWFWATRNWQVTEDRWQKTWFTCHSKNQHKQCKRIELRRWQSLRGSTLAFRSTWSSKKTSKFVKLLALIVNMLIQITCIVQIKPFLLHLKGKLYYGRPLTGTHGAWSHTSHCWAFSSWHTGAQENSHNADACQWLEHGKNCWCMPMTSTWTGDRWQMTGDRWLQKCWCAPLDCPSVPGITFKLQWHQWASNFTCINFSFKFKLQTSRCLKHEAHEVNVHCLFQDLSLMPSCDHHVSTMWPACYHPMPPMASYGPLLWVEPEKLRRPTQKSHLKIMISNEIIEIMIWDLNTIDLFHEERRWWWHLLGQANDNANVFKPHANWIQTS